MTDVLDIANLKDHERAGVLQWAKQELAKEDLIEFCCHIDPLAADRYRAKHLQCIASKLEQVECGLVTRLYITTPPRHWKSSLVSEKFPTWYLARNPKHSVGIFSHGMALPTRFSINVRKNISYNPLFADLFPEVKVDGGPTCGWSLKGAFRLSMRSLGVYCAPTGEGYDLIIVDDPVGDANEANSPAALDKSIRWYRETLRDRLNPGGKIIIVMSRWAKNDLAGYVMAESKSGDGEFWEELRLPALAEPDDVLGRPEGAALWPEWVDEEALAQIKKAQGSRAFAARFQGSPRSEDGNLLNSSKLIMIDAADLPEQMEITVRRWDLAFSEPGIRKADWSAGVKMGRHGDRRFILHVKRVQGKWPKVAPIIKQLADTDGVNCICMVEANGTQKGYADQMIEEIPNRMVEADCPEGNKEMRAAIWGNRLADNNTTTKQGVIYCVRGEWNEELFDEMDYFPNGDNDDIVDGVSGAWNRINQPGGTAKTVDHREQHERLSMPRYRRDRFL